jgi:hypothetical protein
MCATFESLGTQMRPGRIVAVWRGSSIERLRWSGFARDERLNWWLQKGCQPVDVPAVRFAERSRKDGRLHWGDVPAGQVIRGLRDPGGPVALVLIVTRPATAAEAEAFGHDRMPLIVPPLYSCVPIAEETAQNGDSAQLELF